MNNHSISKWERRDYKKDVPLWDAWIIGLAILFLSSLVFFVTTVFHLTDVAEAGDVNPSDIHSMEQACAYAERNPEKIINVQELLASCK